MDRVLCEDVKSLGLEPFNNEDLRASQHMATTSIPRVLEKDEAKTRVSKRNLHDPDRSTTQAQAQRGP